MTEMEFVKKFVEMVHANTPMQGYKKLLGLDKKAFHYHMGNLGKYEEMLRLAAGSPAPAPSVAPEPEPELMPEPYDSDLFTEEELELLRELEKEDGDE